MPIICNIAGPQLHKRKRFMAKCLGLTVWAIFLLELFDFDSRWRLVTVIFFSLSALAVQQVYLKFCYVFGLKGLSGMGEVGKVQVVQDKELRRAYRRRSVRMIITSVLIGMVLAALYYYLGVKFFDQPTAVNLS